MEPFFPLHALVCDECLLVQLDEYVAPDEIFKEYAYFSSYSDSWLAHATSYCEMIAREKGLGSDSFAVELASNDGYLLRNFVTMGIPCLGIEPAKNVAATARDAGIDTLSEFFGKETAKMVRSKYRAADLIVGNNVLAHVPDLNDFVAGMKVLLSEEGTITMEFPHLLRLIEQSQFDTIYHEHFSYLSLTTVERVFAHHGLSVFHVDELSTHGGSLRIYAQHDDKQGEVTSAFEKVKADEERLGMLDPGFYASFQSKVDSVKRDLLAYLIDAKRSGKQIVGYGAPGKGNTLLNYCGIGRDFLDYTVDRNPYKQGKYTPGSRIPILDPDVIKKTKPDVILILPWNLKEEIVSANAYVAEWGGSFVTPIPTVEVITP